MRKSLTLFVFFVISVGALPAPAMETDQFNLPPQPLADIAPEVEAYVAENIQTGVGKLNTEIAAHERCVSGMPFPSAAFGTRDPSTAIVEAPPNRVSSPHVSKGSTSSSDNAGRVRCSSTPSERAKLDQLRSPDAVAKAVYEQLGSGTIFITKTGTWLNTHKFEHEPSRYKAPYTESIYWERPINYATLSPTIRMYGVEFGTDKLDHMFQQGYTYYGKYTAARKEGKKEDEAIAAAVGYGRTSENLFFGYAVSGVYSNADLAANIAGLKFYLGLASRINIYDEGFPPVVEVIDGRWKITHTGAISEYSPGKSDTPRIVYRFVSRHLNEVYNPSNYLPLLFPLIKSAVQKRACPKWRAALSMLTAAEVKDRFPLLNRWNGLEYGYRDTGRQVRVADVCFADAGFNRNASARAE